MSDQAINHRQRDLRNAAIVVLVIGFICRGFGAFVPTLSVIGTIGVILGVVALVAWLIIRAQKR